MTVTWFANGDSWAKSGHAACFCGDHELRMVFTFHFTVIEKNQMDSILCQVKLIRNSKFSVHE